MRSLTFRVNGAVAGQGSKTPGVSKSGKIYMREAAKGHSEWRKRVTDRAALALLQREAHDDPWPRDLAALQVEASFAIARPQKHYKGNDPSRELRDDAPLYCANTPDVDKCARAVLDALNRAGVYVDDRRVVRLVATTLYAGPGVGEPGAVIVVSPMVEGG